MKEIIFLLIPFIINLALVFSTNYWGFETNKDYVLYGSIAGIIGTLLIYRYKNQISWIDSQSNFSKYAPWIFGIQFFLFNIYNICNLSYGDGIILFENVFLEGSIFGYQSTIDELLEAFLHSKLFVLFGGDPRVYYRITSTICGFLYLLFTIIFLNRNSNSLLDSFVFLSPAGILLFYGYTENYSLVAIFVLLTLILGIYFIRSGKSDKSIYIMAGIASIGALFHLVYGFIGISLIYFAMVQSTPGRFLRNVIISAFIAILFLVPIFSYFLFFADATIHASQTHAFTLPIYPFKRLISMNHFKDIMGVIWFTSFFPFIAILYSKFFQSHALPVFFKKPEIRFILLTIFGFFIQAFTINPMLGFPADWDLMSFYWIPLVMLAYLLLHAIGKEKIVLLPLMVYAIGFQVYTARSLHENPEKLEIDYKLTMEIASDYVTTKKGLYKDISQKKKKLFLKLDHFIFKSASILKNQKTSQSKDLVKELNQFEKELSEKTFTEDKKYDKIWIRDFLARLTEFHHRFLEYKKANQL